jgi:hypothetical protein
LTIKTSSVKWRALPSKEWKVRAVFYIIVVLIKYMPRCRKKPPTTRLRCTLSHPQDCYQWST